MELNSNSPISLNFGIQLIDLYDLNMDERTGSYVIKDEKTAIIETSASPSIPHLLKGLHTLNIHPSEIDYIIVTHIHLDHAGGVGVMMEHCPNAKVIVHPRGARHLSNPSRLIAGAKSVYGDKFDELFDPILPVREEHIIAKNDGEVLTLGKNRVLTFYDTPGHASHHFSIHDSKSNGVFTGDTFGVYYHQLQNENVTFVLPSTSPNQFNPERMLESARRIEALNPARIYFGHYGMCTDPHEVFRQLREWLPIFVEAGRKGYDDASHSDYSIQSCTIKINQYLYEAVSQFLDTNNIPKNHDIYNILNVDMKVCSMGLADYFIKNAEAESK